MPTKKRRITISLDDDVYNSVEMFSRTFGTSIAAVINQSLKGCVKPFDETVRQYHKASALEDEEERNKALRKFDSDVKWKLETVKGVINSPFKQTKACQRPTSDDERMSEGGCERGRADG